MKPTFLILWLGGLGVLAALLAVTPDAPASTLERSWPGTDFVTSPGSAPPDPHGAAGPSGVLATVNTYIAYYEKSGTPIWGPVNLANFFTNTANSGAGIADPKVIYDVGTQRFFVIIQENTTNQPFQSFFHIAVTRNSHPLTILPSDWSWYRYQMTETILGDSCGGDYPGLAVDGQALYVTFNMYPLPLGRLNPRPWDTAARRARIFAVNKASLLSGSLQVQSTIADTGFTLQPATVIGGTTPGNVAYFAQIDGPATARIWALNNPLGGSGPLVPYEMPIPLTGTPLLGAPQSGTSVRLDTVTPFRAQGNAFWRDGSLWFCYTGADLSARARVWFYEIRTHELGLPLPVPLLKRQGTLQENNPEDWDFQPAIGGNAAGDVCIVFSRTSGVSWPQILYATLPHYAGPFDTFERPQSLRTSQGFYNGTQAPAKNGARWGDYAIVAADPSDGSFWVCHEYSRGSTRANDWGTWWGNVVVPRGLVYVDHNNPCVRPEDLAEPFRTLAGYVPGWSWGTQNGLGVTLDPRSPPPNAPQLPCPPPPLPCSISVCLGGPYKKVQDALNGAADGDQLVIKAANYDERPRITRRRILSAEGGSVFIGKP